MVWPASSRLKIGQLWSSIADRGLPLASVPGEGVTPLARLLAEALVSGRGEASGAKLPRKLQRALDALTGHERLDFMRVLADGFAPDPTALPAVAEAYPADPSAVPAARLAEPLRTPLLHAAARFLTTTKGARAWSDPVARFDLGDGAIQERLNWLGNTDVRGLRDSQGIIVNDLYCLSRIEASQRRSPTRAASTGPPRPIPFSPIPNPRRVSGRGRRRRSRSPRRLGGMVAKGRVRPRDRNGLIGGAVFDRTRRRPYPATFTLLFSSRSGNLPICNLSPNAQSDGEEAASVRPACVRVLRRTKLDLTPIQGHGFPLAAAIPAVAFGKQANQSKKATLRNT